MRKYIKAYENYIPICIEEGQNVALIDVNEEAINYCSLDSSTQFNYSKIINEEFSRHVYTSRLISFIMGKGIVSLRYNNIIQAIICRDGFVLVNKSWEDYHPNEFKRFKKCLTEAGYKTRGDKCFVFVIHLEDKITIDPIKPTMEDYEPSVQLTNSSEFIALEKAKYPIINDEFPDLALTSGKAQEHFLVETDMEF